MRPDQIPPVVPERSKPRQSIDGVQLPPVRFRAIDPTVRSVQPNTSAQIAPRGQPVTPMNRPEYRYNHELPAPAQPHMIKSRHQELLAAPHHPVEPIAPGRSDELPLVSIDLQTTPSNVKTSAGNRKILLWSVVLLLIGICVAFIGLYGWYARQLTPVSDDQKSAKVLVTIPEGTTPEAITKLLKSDSLIRSESAFMAYLKISGTQNQLKAGAYSLQPSQSSQQIVEHIITGINDEFDMTFLPGATLAKHRDGLIRAGFSAKDVDAALKATYSGLLFDGKPDSADLEGYIYGETYRFTADATPSQVLQRTFDEFEKQAVAAKLQAGFKKQGLTMFEGITLASIVQREVSSTGDMKQVAQVFYSRLNKGMTLGSDVTYHYAADKMNVARRVDLDSPYNTRLYPGLPPGPIASPGLQALIATAYPATGDFLFFVSGDDDKTYFSKTNDEHDRNVAKYCVAKCQLP